MTTAWGTLTIGTTPVRISATKLKCCKLFFQVAPQATGLVKIGGSAVTTANSTPGTVLDPPSVGANPDGASYPSGGSWDVATEGVNSIDASEYYVHGSHSGDLVFYEYHQT